MTPVNCHILALACAFLAGTNARAAADATPSRFVRDGVAVELAILPPVGAVATATPRAGENARVRFTLTDTTTGQPVTRLRPAAWFSRRGAGATARPRTCAEKIQELLGGSIFSKAELDLNTFQVLALNDDATITVVDPLFGFGGTKLLALIPLPGDGADWTLMPDGRRLLVSVPSTGQVVLVDAASWKTVATLDAGAGTRRLAIQPDGRFAWAAHAGGITVIDPDRSEIVAQVATGRGPHEIVFSADSRWAFVVHSEAQTLSVVDVRTRQKIKDVPLGCTPASAAWSSAGEAVYLTDEAGGHIVVFDAVKHDVIARIAAEPGLGEVKFAPGGRFGFVANPARNLVLVVDAATNRIVQRAKIEQGPEQFTFSAELAYVRRRGTSTVAMIPLKEIGREGRPLAVAEFTGGEAAFGARTSLGGGIVPAPGGASAVVANPRDKTIYYYKEGMAAPMGNFSNYRREPRAVLVVDRSLREVAPGAYEVAADLPAAGDYDAVFFLDSPRITHCFSAAIAPNPGQSAQRGALAARLEPVAESKPQLIAGRGARVVFRLRPAIEGQPVAAPGDLVVRTLLAPGIWHARHTPSFAPDGTCVLEFTPPQPGLYYFYAESAALGLASNQPPVLVLNALEPIADK